MTLPHSIPALVPLDADRAALIAHLDASDQWERRDLARPSAYLRWTLADRIAPDMRGLRPDVTLPNDQNAPYVDEGAACADAVHTINSVAFGIDPHHNEPAVVERLIAIYHQAGPDSDIARLAAGLVETT
ncbi:hypothetical protein ETD86_29630 [Nonomuraea turkmeniaca]|uniref:Uncharacterized protein n=1 Tax=Nonomuraea turkmeniaca TaxID=103838 RepID=A0A5S4FAK0_9ACTN|nr:hypothetical protein [Nonomuraea turkmeniaca]TMR14109.1 hypothetical protein ETD86_29630 [Nonomuraea turkmeniaca]